MIAPPASGYLQHVVLLAQMRSGFSDARWSIPTIRADFFRFASKLVQISPYLPGAGAICDPVELRLLSIGVADTTIGIGLEFEFCRVGTRLGRLKHVGFVPQCFDR
jgi:hypothetical protein